MSVYTPNKQLLSFGLEELGTISLGLPRLPNETLDNYRRRLLLEARDPNGPTEADFIKSVNRQVGLFETPVFQIDVIRDSNDDPLAADPHVEITSTYLRAYSDWDNSTLDFEIDFGDRVNGYFLREINTAFGASSFFNITVLDTDHTFKLSSHLRFDNTERFVNSEFIADSRSIKLKNNLIRDIYPQNVPLYQQEVASVALILEIGDFYVDYVGGNIFVYEPAGGFMTYAYKQFPWTMYWQPVKVWPYNDPDKKYKYYNSLIDDDTGLGDNTLLNVEGAELANIVLGVHPLGWGV